MKFYYVTFRSVTHGQRGEKLLKQQGIRCTLLRTPKWMEEQGCGYSLRLRAKDLQMALEMLRREEVPFRKIYWQKEKGWVEDTRT